MLTNDNSNNIDFSSKESYMQSLRERSQSNGGRSGNDKGSRGVSSAGNALRGAVSVGESDNRGYASQGGATEYAFQSTDGGTTYSAGRPDRTTIGTQRGGDGSPGDDGSSYQYQRPATATTNIPRPKWSVKNIYHRYRDAVRKDKVVDSQPKKRVAHKHLTDAEALKLRPKLIEYMVWQSEHLDQFIIATTGGHDSSIEIWGDLSYAEIEILVDFLIQRGRTDGGTAQAVRYASVIIDRLKLAVIIAPRIYKTVNIYLVKGISIAL